MDIVLSTCSTSAGRPAGRHQLSPQGAGFGSFSCSFSYALLLSLASGEKYKNSQADATMETRTCECERLNKKMRNLLHSNARLR